jgi:hypothetical protein
LFNLPGFELPGIALDGEGLSSHGLFEVKLDDGAGPHNAHAVLDIQLLVLRRHDSEEYNSQLEGILTVASNNQPHAFERVGHFIVRHDDVPPLLAAYEKAEVQTIKLV